MEQSGRNDFFNAEIAGSNPARATNHQYQKPPELSGDFLISRILTTACGLTGTRILGRVPVQLLPAVAEALRREARPLARRSRMRA